MAPRSGVGSPPEGCTCLLVHSFVDRPVEYGVVHREVEWSVYIADPTCPAHAVRIRTAS